MDQIKTSFESAVFNDEPGSFIYVNRMYASISKPESNDNNLKLIKVFEKPNQYDLQGRPAFCGTYGDEKCDLDRYESIYKYRPLYNIREIKKMEKDIGYDKYLKELEGVWKNRNYDEYSVFDENGKKIFGELDRSSV